MNERLPHFQPADETFPVIPAPSMRRYASGDIEGLSMEALIKRTLDEDNEEGDLVGRISDQISMGRKATGRPMALKRFEAT